MRLPRRINRRRILGEAAGAELVRGCAIGTTTFTILFVFAGETSPKFIVTNRSFRTLELPVTEPPDAPVIVGAPPLEMSKFWAATLPKLKSETTQMRIGILNVLLFILVTVRLR